jgi:hypothetical protein
VLVVATATKTALDVERFYRDNLVVGEHVSLWEFVRDFDTRQWTAALHAFLFFLKNSASP